MQNLLETEEFKRLEKLYPFLSHAREDTLKLEKEVYIIVDIETTGLDPLQNEIIEIGALKVENKEIKDVFNSLIKPSSIISPQIEKLTGINQEMLEDHPKISKIIPKFLSFIQDHPLVAHNADFDIPFLKHHLNKKIENQLICTLKLSRFLLPNLTNHKLHTVAGYFGINALNQHRALGDVETTYNIWIKMMPLLREKGIFSKEDIKKITH